MILTPLLLSLLPAATGPEAPTTSPTAPNLTPTGIATLLSYRQEEEEELPAWSGSFSLGATVTRGNSETNSLAANFDAERRDEMDRWTIKAFWTYQDQAGDNGGTDVTQRRIGANTKYDYFVDDKLYYNGIAGVESDGQANLDLRYYLGGGVGYQWREDEDFKLGTEAGLVYFNEEFADGDDDSSLSLRLASDLKHQVTETTLFKQTAEVFPAVDDLDDYFARIDNQVRLDVTESMFAQVQYVLNFDHTPADNTKQADHLVVVGVGWSF